MLITAITAMSPLSLYRTQLLAAVLEDTRRTYDPRHDQTWKCFQHITGGLTSFKNNSTACNVTPCRPIGKRNDWADRGLVYSTPGRSDDLQARRATRSIFNETIGSDEWGELGGVSCWRQVQARDRQDRHGSGLYKRWNESPEGVLIGWGQAVRGDQGDPWFDVSSPRSPGPRGAAAKTAGKVAAKVPVSVCKPVKRHAPWKIVGSVL
jgi:hypothetical protein